MCVTTSNKYLRIRKERKKVKIPKLLLSSAINVEQSFCFVVHIIQEKLQERCFSYREMTFVMEMEASACVGMV